MSLKASLGEEGSPSLCVSFKEISSKKNTSNLVSSALLDFSLMSDSTLPFHFPY